MTLQKVIHVNDLASRLEDLNDAVQGMTHAHNVDERDLALLDEAQHACNVGAELLLENRPVQARYAYVFAELCVAVVQGNACPDRFRGLLEELVRPS